MLAPQAANTGVEVSAANMATAGTPKNGALTTNILFGKSSYNSGNEGLWSRVMGA